MGENSDGVVPLSSQPRLEAQAEAKAQFGFNAGHADILQDGVSLDYLIPYISNVKTIYPDDHIKVVSHGGFEHQGYRSTTGLVDYRYRPDGDLLYKGLARYF